MLQNSFSLFKLTFYCIKNQEKTLVAFQGYSCSSSSSSWVLLQHRQEKDFPSWISISTLNRYILDININLKQVYPGYQYQPKIDISWILISTINRYILDINIIIKQIYPECVEYSKFQLLDL